MTLFSTTRSKRYTAFLLLLVWLFVLGSGVANACLLGPTEEHASSVSASDAQTRHASAEPAFHRDAAAEHGDHHGPAKDSCLKACEDGSRTLVKAYSGLDQTDPGLAPLVTTLWASEKPVVLALSRIDGLQAPIVGLPVRVRYSRLAL